MKAFGKEVCKFFFNIYFYYNYLKIIYSDKKKETGINRN